MFISYDSHNIIKAVSAQCVHGAGQTTIKTSEITGNLVGRRLVLGKKREGLRVAAVYNAGDKCGISSYSQNLINALRPKVDEIKIFAEHIPNENLEEDKKNGVVRCWTRGESLVEMCHRIIDYAPDCVTLQHEFGLFPLATHFLKMLEILHDVPTITTLHSVYSHLDKTIATAHIKRIIVHSEVAKQSLVDGGHLGKVDVIFHGCHEIEDHSELFNFFGNPYVCVSAGFGFAYKGVSRTIDAIAHLKKTQEKYKDIFFLYLCTESPHTAQVQRAYYNFLSDKVAELGLTDNVAILRGYLSEKIMNNFYRTAKLAVFSYVNDGDNIVYGASGAIRNAIACGIPTIASDHAHFSEFEGILPRPSDHLELAREIDEVFSNELHRKNLVDKGLAFVKNNNWDITADKHIAVFRDIIAKHEADIIRVENYEVV